MFLLATPEFHWQVPVRSLPENLPRDSRIWIGLGFLAVAAFIGWLVLFFHARRQRGDRALAFKKKLYAEASDNLAESLQILRRALSNDSTAAATLRGVQQFHGSLGKVLTVSAVETQKVALRLNEHYVEILDKLEPFAERLGEERRKQEHFRAELKRLDDAFEVSSEKMLDVLLTSNSADAQQSVLQQIREHQKTLELHHHNIQTLHDQSVRTESETHLAGSEALVGLFDALQFSYADLIIAFRRELRLKSDEEWFRSEIEKDARRARQAGLQTVERARAKLAPPEPPAA